MRFIVQPAFVAYLVFSAMCTSPAESIGVVIALFIHEAGHLFASVLFGFRPERIELTPFGGVVEYKAGKGPDKGIRGALTALAGPAGNYLTLILLGYCSMSVPLYGAIYSALAKSSFVMLCVNLLPALPLDGGRLLFSLGYYFLPVLPLISILTGLGVAIGCIYLVGTVYGVWCYSDLNLSLLLIGGYMIYCAKRCRMTLLAENMFAVIYERKIESDAMQKIHAFSVGENTALREIIPLLDSRRKSVFLREGTEGSFVFFEEQVCRELLRNPSGSFSDL